MSFKSIKRVLALAALPAVSAAIAIALTACTSQDDLRQQRGEKADKHFEALQKRAIPADVTLTLPQCIEAALKNNLDLKVDNLKESIAKEKRTAEILGMLPDLTVSEDLTHRNNQPGSSSESLITGQQSLEPSKSSETTEADTKVELALSTLDFGLAYFNSLQAHDKVFHEGQQAKRTAQNLVVDVVTAYFKVASTQYAVEKTEKLLALCDKVDADLENLASEKAISPLRALDEETRFITQRKRLMEFRRSYENSCMELRSLMGYLPSKDIKVDVSCLDKLNTIAISDPDILSRIAIKERPELYQLDLQQHITVLEARKTILMMFPNVRAFTDFNNSTNKYLYNQSWMEVGLHAAYNLLKLPQQIEQYRTLDKEADSIDVKTMAMTVGVLAQVRIAHANMMEVKDRYELDQRIYNTHKKHLDYAKSNADALGKLTPLDIARLELETAEASIDRTQSLGNYYLAYYRLLNTIGVEAIDQKKIDETVAKLADEAVKEAEAEKSATPSDSLTEAEAEAIRDTMDFGSKSGAPKSTAPEAINSPEPDAAKGK